MVTQSRPTVCDPVDYSLLGSSVHGISQARILEWVCHFLLQGFFPTQGLNPGLLHCRQTLYRLSHQGRCSYHWEIINLVQAFLSLLLYAYDLLIRGFPGGSDSKESSCKAGDPGSIPELGRFPGEGNGYPLQYSCLENSMDREEPGGLQSMGSQRIRHN